MLDPHLHIQPLKRKIVVEMVRHGQNPAQFGFDVPDDAPDILRQLYDPDTESTKATAMFAALDESQLEVAQLFADPLNPTNVLLDSPGGYGKSAVAAYFPSHYRGRSHGVHCFHFDRCSQTSRRKNYAQCLRLWYCRALSLKIRVSISTLQLRQALLIIIDEVYTVSKSLMEMTIVRANRENRSELHESINSCILT